MVRGLLSSQYPQDGSSASVKDKPPSAPPPLPAPTHCDLAKQLLLVSTGEISLFCYCDSPAMGTVLSGLSPWHRSGSSFALFFHEVHTLKQPGYIEACSGTFADFVP